jgi:hypothetical protein
MASNIESDGKTVTVTTEEGHRIGFAMSELNVGSTSGDITTDWAGGVPPSSVERCVRAAKSEAEAYAAQHHPSKPDEARAAQQENKGLGGAVKDALGLP